MVVLRLGLVNQTRISSGSSHECSDHAQNEWLCSMVNPTRLICMCLIKIVELATTMQRGVHLNKSWLDLMHNRGGIDVAFLLHMPESLPLSI